MEALLTTENGISFGLWLVIGVALSWGRNLRLAAVVPLLVTGLPVFFLATSDGLGVGNTPAMSELLPMLGIPLLGSIVGGNAGIAIAPQRRARKAARTAYEKAKREAERLGAEIYALRDAAPVIEMSTARQPAVVAAPAAAVPVLYEVGTVRTRLAMREDRLRAIGRTLAEAG